MFRTIFAAKPVNVFFEVVISQTETASLCDNVDGSVEHHLLTASAKVDGNPVTMLADGGSANAEAPLTVVNTRGFDLPETGDNGTMMFTIVGILLMAGVYKPKEELQESSMPLALNPCWRA